jgi:AcrR family transcriptional regulator
MMNLAMEAQPATSRRPGRPRDARADDAILEATLDTLIEVGYEGLIVERVAERAGVAKATVYRRWPSKQELVIAALDSLHATLQIPDSGDVRADLVLLIRQAQHFLTQTKGGQVLPRVVGEFASGTPVGRAFIARVLLPRIAGVQQALERAKQRGGLREDLDLDLALPQIIGPIVFLHLLGKLHDMDAGFPERLARQVLDGMGGPAIQPADRQGSA